MSNLKIMIQPNELSADISDRIKGYSRIHILVCRGLLAFRKANGVPENDIKIEEGETYELKDIVFVINGRVGQGKSFSNLEGELF